MLPLVDKPLIQYSVEEAVASGIESILIVTGRDKSAIENHFDISYELENLLREKIKPNFSRWFARFPKSVAFLIRAKNRL